MKPDLFLPSLVISIGVHSLVLTVGGFFSTPVQYSVVQAPQSMEVVFTETQPIVARESAEVKVEEMTFKETAPVLNIQSAKDETQSFVVSEDSFKKIEKIQSAKIIQPSVMSDEKKGAVVEANPSLFENPSPLYPQLARRKGWEGTVILRVFLTEEGVVKNISVEKSSGHRMLDESALKTVSQWTFEPARQGNQRFSSEVKVPIRFVLVE